MCLLVFWLLVYLKRKIKIKQARFFYLDDTTWHSVPARTHPNSSLLIIPQPYYKSVPHGVSMAIGGEAGWFRGLPV